jgi:hypothetical protein
MSQVYTYPDGRSTLADFGIRIVTLNSACSDASRGQSAPR